MLLRQGELSIYGVDHYFDFWVWVGDFVRKKKFMQQTTVEKKPTHVQWNENK